MSACPHCGYSDPGGWRECPACGQFVSLTPTPGIPSGATPSAYGAPPGGGQRPGGPTPPPGYGPGSPPPGYGAPPYGAPPYGAPPYGAPPYGAPGSYGAPRPANPYAAPVNPSAPPAAYAYHYSQPAILPTSGKAIASMVMGICSIVIYPLGIILGPLAIAFWATARADFQDVPPAYKGNGMAIAGLVTGIIGSLFGLLILGVFIAAACAASRAPGPHY